MRKIKIFLSFLLFAFLIFGRVNAGPELKVLGWAWSENVGWISFNCYNYYNGFLEDHCSSSNYGVNLDLSTGLLSGYAWVGGGEAGGDATATIGWISFNTSSLVGCPDGNCVAKVNTTTGEVSGWARACSVFRSGCSGTTSTNTGGWDGWIKLRGTNYGVTLNPSTDEFEGWAAGWDDSSTTAVVGWISFNCKNQGVCSASNYKVFLQNQPPQITKFKVIDDACAYGSSPLTIPSGGYRMQIDWDATDTDSLTATITIRKGIDTIFSTTTTNKPFTVPGGAGIEFNNTYTITLEVSDGEISVSTSTTFRTPEHQYPYVNFKWSPERPLVGQPVQFCSVSTGTCATMSGLSECNDICTSTSWSWTFNNATPSTSIEANPQVTFNSAGTSSVTLTITNDIGSCHNTVNLNLRRPLPFWEEMKLRVKNFFASLIENLRKFFRV